MASAPNPAFPSSSSPFRESPRIRRLRNDLRALEQLRAESSILEFAMPGATYGGPPESYVVRFHGRGACRAPNSEIVARELHEVHIHLGAAYPRMMPQLSWRTPIFHPNISASGVVCLGGYGTYWVPSLGLDELCEMLWDMVRYRNFDVKSPYNREAAQWASSQPATMFPLDPRPVRDRIASTVRADDGTASSVPVASLPVATPVPSEIQFLGEVVEAELAATAPPGPDLLYIE